MSDLLIVICLATCFGYVCRLSGINFKTTKAVYVVLNALLLAQTGYTAYAIKTQGIGFEVLGLGVSILYLYTTWPTWRFSAPLHTMKHPEKVKHSK